MVIDPVTGEITDAIDPASAQLTAAARALQDLTREHDRLAAEIEANERERDRILADILPALSSNVPVTAAGITFTRKPGRRANRAVNRAAIDRHAADLPPALRPWREAKIDAALLTDEQVRHASGQTERYPTVAAVTEHARDLRAAGIDPGDVLLEPPPADDMVDWHVAVDAEA